MRATRACTCAGVQACGEEEEEEDIADEDEEGPPAGVEVTGLATEWEGRGGMAAVAAERERDGAVGGREERVVEDEELREEDEDEGGWVERKREMAEQRES